MHDALNFKKVLVAGALGLGAFIIFGLWWLFFLSPANPDGNLGWYLFAFATGLTMIVLPCTLPLAFVIVPLSMGKGLQRGLGIALAFGTGVALMLSIYGIIAAMIGAAAIDQLGAPLEVVKNWVYFIAGIFAYLFALGEIGLIKVRMPSYTGAAPAFIQHQGDFVKAFLLGLFLGNIGVGCPHPATPLLLVEIASSGTITYGWTLFLTHAIGRILPLVLLAVLAILGVNGLNWLVTRKDRIEKATGWAMVFVAGFILVLGLFSHAWWVASGSHTMFEKITQEHLFLDILRENLNSTVTHAHGVEETVGMTGLFGLPLAWGNWALVALWIFPLWWWWRKEKDRIAAIPQDTQVPEHDAEQGRWRSRGWGFAALSLLLASVFIWALPQWFVQQASQPHDHSTASMPMMDHVMEMMEHMEGDGHDHSAADGHEEHAAMYREETEITRGLAVSVMTEPVAPMAGELVKLSFYAHTRPDNLPYEDLSISHEKYMHVVGVREDLGEFLHLHPIRTEPGLWETEYTFDEAGEYKLYVDVVDAEGMAHTFGQQQFAVAAGADGSGQAVRIPVEFLWNVVVDGYQVAMERDEPLVASRTSGMRFTVRDVYGNGVELEDYLSVPMHLAAINVGLDQYVHTHPVDHAHAGEPVQNVPGTPGFDESKPHSHSLNWMLGTDIAEAHSEPTGPAVASEPVSFDVPFEKEGVYRVFAQFRPKGAALGSDEAAVAAFFVNVESETGQTVTKLASAHEETATADPSEPMSPQEQKLLLTLVSLVLMGALSLYVYRKIKVQ